MFRGEGRLLVGIAMLLNRVVPVLKLTVVFLESGQLFVKSDKLAAMGFFREVELAPKIFKLPLEQRTIAEPDLVFFGECGPEPVGFGRNGLDSGPTRSSSARAASSCSSCSLTFASRSAETRSIVRMSSWCSAQGHRELVVDVP